MLNTNNLPFKFSHLFKRNIQSLIDEAAEINKSGLIINFKDPCYSFESGGFRPVEIAITPNLELAYITEFHYVGLPPFVELAKSVDFDFSTELFQQNDQLFPLVTASEFFVMWLDNFVQYWNMDIYSLTTSSYY